MTPPRGVGQPPPGYASSSSSPSTQRAPASTTEPELTAWPEDKRVLPSALFIGESGSGKTFAIGRVLAAGLNVGLVAVEPKYQVLRRYAPPLFDASDPRHYGGVPPTPTQKYDKLRRFVDMIGAGKFRAFDGAPLDALAFDGLTELVEVIHRSFKERLTSKTHMLGMWEDIGLAAVDYFKALRDASCTGATPMPVIATCLEIPQMLGDVLRWVPQMPGNKAAQSLKAQFEAVFRLQVGVDGEGAQEFRVYTVGTDTFTAKAPPGLYSPVVIGKGVTVDGQPDVGAMFKQLLTDPKSPYAGAGELTSGLTP